MVTRVVNILVSFLEVNKDGIEDLDHKQINRNIYTIVHCYVEAQKGKVRGETIRRHLDALVNFGSFLTALNSRLDDRSMDKRFVHGNFKAVIEVARKETLGMQFKRGFLSRNRSKQSMMIPMAVSVKFETCIYIEQTGKGTLGLWQRTGHKRRYNDSRRARSEFS